MTIARLKDILVNALEGGANYWYQIDGHDFPAGVSYADFRENGKFVNKENYAHPDEIIPFTPGCASLIRDSFGDHVLGVWLNRTSLLNASDMMYELHPAHYADILTEDDDAITGDVLLQLAVYGELVYE